MTEPEDLPTHSEWLRLFRYNFILSGECWLWDGRIMSTGYGVMGHDDLVHRKSWETLNGKTTRLVLFSCQNRHCINPKHLFLGPEL